MRSLWLDRETGPDPVKVKAHGISCLVEDIRDASKASVTANAKWGASGVYAVVGKGAGWPEVPTAARAAADWCHEKLDGCDLGKPERPLVHLNYEGDEPEWIDAFLLRWRAHRPSRWTLWTMQAHKADVYAATAVIHTCRGKRIYIGPQCYVGQTPMRVESANEVYAWAELGFPLWQIQPFLMAEDLGAWWGEKFSATAFIAGRLP